MHLETFGDLREFLHSASPDCESFAALVEAMFQAHAERPEEVETSWLPYALDYLDAWEDEARRWPDDFDFEDIDDAGESDDRFLTRDHPLYALGRALDIEGGAGDLVLAYVSAPGARHLSCFGSFLFDELSLEHLDLILRAPAVAALKQLSFGFGPFQGEHLERLARSPALEGLERLGLIDVAIGVEDLEHLLRSPHLKGLRCLNLDRFHPPFAFQSRMMDALPELEAITGWERGRRKGQWGIPACFPEELIALRGASDRERIEGVLADSGYYGGVLEGELDPDGLELDEVLARLGVELAWHEDRIRVVVAERDSWERAFDDEGRLIAPLELKLWSRNLPITTGSHVDAGYRGAHYVQANLAMVGLAAERRGHSVVVVAPEGCREATALVRMMSAMCELQEEWNVITIPCTPWHVQDAWQEIDPPSREFPNRGGMSMGEFDFEFDEAGELGEGVAQGLCYCGDMVLFCRVFARHGLALERSQREERFDYGYLRNGEG